MVFLQKNHVFGMRVYNERLSRPGFKTGHVGFYVEDELGQKRHFDHGMVGSGISKGSLPKIFETACTCLPVAGVAVYSLLGLAVAKNGLETSLLSAFLGSYAGGLYGCMVGFGIGITVETGKPMPDTAQEIRINISKEQYDDVIEYTKKNKFSVYSASIKNCITYTETMMRNCGIATAGPLSGTLTMPSTFGKKTEAVYTPNAA